MVASRGSVRSTRGLGPTMIARDQSIGIYWYATANTDYVDYDTKDIQVLHYGIWPWRRILNGARIIISNLPENIAWQTLRPEARGPLKSGAWGGRPTCHPQTPPLVARTLLNEKFIRTLSVFLLLWQEVASLYWTQNITRVTPLKKEFESSDCNVITEVKTCRLSTRTENDGKAWYKHKPSYLEYLSLL